MRSQKGDRVTGFKIHDRHMPLAAIEGFEGIGAIPAKDLVSAFLRADQIVATKAVNPLLFLRSCELIRAIRTAQLSFLAQSPSWRLGPS